jgi:hypothetical protein
MAVSNQKNTPQSDRLAFSPLKKRYLEKTPRIERNQHLDTNG